MTTATPEAKSEVERRPAPARRRGRWLPTFAMLLGVALFVWAGNWQHARMETKALLRAQYDSLAQSAPAPLPDKAVADDWSGERFRRVLVRGEYDRRHQIYLDNKVRQGRAGYEIVTPLKLDDGRVVLVDRGWLPVGPSRDTLPAAPPADGPVGVEGRLDLPPAHYVEFGTRTVSGPLWQNLDLGRYAQSTGLSVLPVVVQQTAAPVPDDGLLRDWPQPDFGIEQHRVYMLQWYALAGVCVVLWLALNWRKAGQPRC